MNPPGSLKTSGLILMLIFLLSTGSCASVGSSSIVQIQVTPAQAQMALDAALTRRGCPYEWAGNGPDIFDCSGLVAWAYQTALNDSQVFSDGSSVVSDVTMDTLFKHNVVKIQATEALPGDLVFITTDPEVVTHGGLVHAMQADSVSFINASSYYHMVLVDEWPLTGTVRGQWIAGYGRLLARAR